jgi:hypothetical protein
MGEGDSESEGYSKRETLVFVRRIRTWVEESDWLERRRRGGSDERRG